VHHSSFREKHKTYLQTALQRGSIIGPLVPQSDRLTAATCTAIRQWIHILAGIIVSISCHCMDCMSYIPVNAIIELFFTYIVYVLHAKTCFTCFPGLT